MSLKKKKKKDTAKHTLVHTDPPSAIGTTVAGGIHASRGGSVWGVLDWFWKIDLPDDLTRGRSDLPPQSGHLAHRANRKVCKRSAWTNSVRQKDAGTTQLSLKSFKCSMLFI